MHVAGRCSTNGKLRDGGAKILIGSWSYTMCRDSTSKLWTLLGDQRTGYVSLFTHGYIDNIKNPLQTNKLHLQCRETRLTPGSGLLERALEWPRLSTKIGLPDTSQVEVKRASHRKIFRVAATSMVVVAQAAKEARCRPWKHQGRQPRQETRHPFP